MAISIISRKLIDRHTHAGTGNLLCGVISTMDIKRDILVLISNTESFTGDLKSFFEVPGSFFVSCSAIFARTTSLKFETNGQKCTWHCSRSPLIEKRTIESFRTMLEEDKKYRGGFLWVWKLPLVVDSVNVATFVVSFVPFRVSSFLAFVLSTISRFPDTHKHAHAGLENDWHLIGAILPACQRPSYFRPITVRLVQFRARSILSPSPGTGKQHMDKWMMGKCL